MTPTTVYDRVLDCLIAERCKGMTLPAVIAAMRSMHLLDPIRCKAFLAKELVAEMVAAGMPKVDAMYVASDRLCCSYESVRKYVYYNYK